MFAGVLDDLTQRIFDRARHDADVDSLVFVRTFELLDGHDARIRATPPPVTTRSATATFLSGAHRA
jgi:hypothetical protein